MEQGTVYQSENNTEELLVKIQKHITPGTYPILLQLRRKAGEGMEETWLSYLLESQKRSVLTAKTCLFFQLGILYWVKL